MVAKSYLLLTALSLFTLLSYTAHAQSVQRCSTDQLHQQRMQDPDYAAAWQQRMANTRLWLKNHSAQAKMNCEEILFIPVAVHFMDVDIDPACAVDMALSQIDSLNLDFAGTNWDISKWLEGRATTWPGINNKESCIQFCLAQFNHPASAGIAEGDYAVTINQYPEGDNLPEWSGYLNFFVINLSGVLGFSPLGGQGNGDGVTIGVSYFGSVDCGATTIDATYGEGRTATHEVGHYLSLPHPFDSGNCTVDGDNVADTPFTDQETYGCYAVGEEFINCTEPVLWPDYMDYADDNCMYMFTQDQVEQMEGYVNANLTNLLGNATTVCADALCGDFSAAASKVDQSCEAIDGRIAIAATGGTTPYSYSINGGLTGSDNGIFENLEAGVYPVVVTDANACVDSFQVTIAQEQPSLEVTAVQDAFCGDNSGSIQVASSTAGDFQFRLNQNPPQASTLFDNLSSGTYQVTITNEICSRTVTATVGESTDFELVVNELRSVNCPLQDNGLIDIQVLNADPPVVWRLNEGNPLPSGYFDRLSTGTYTVTVSDAAGCIENYDFTIGRSYLNIDDDCPCELFVPNAFTPDFDGINDVFKATPSCPITEYKMLIYNRFGELIFESSDPGVAWNGNAGDGYLVEGELFFYRITYRWGLDRNATLEVQFKQGHITVLR